MVAGRGIRVVADPNGIDYYYENAAGQRVTMWGAVLDPRGERLCACGCGVRFTPARKDQRFTGPTCRVRWHRAQADIGH